MRQGERGERDVRYEKGNKGKGRERVEVGGERRERSGTRRDEKERRET